MPPYLPSTTSPTQRFRSSRGRRGKSQSANSDLLTTPSPFASNRSPNNALYAPTRLWRRGPADDAAVAALRGELRNAPAPPTLNKARTALQRALRLTESVKTVPLRAFLDAYGDVFEVRRDRVLLR